MLDCGDVIQIVATVVTAVIGVFTIWTALYIGWSARWPDVVAYFEADRDNGVVEFVVKNFGSGVAYDVKIADFDYDVVQPGYRDNARFTFIRNGIPMLVPGSDRRTIVFETSWAKDSLRGVNANVSVSYKRNSLFGRKQEMSIDCALDYDSCAYAVYKHTIGKEMADSLKSIAKSMKN